MMWMAALAIAAAGLDTLPAADAARVTVPDTVFQQEIGAKIATDWPVKAVAALDGAVFAGGPNGVFRIRNGALAGPEWSGPVERMETLGGAVYAIGGGKLARYAAGAWTAIDGEGYSDLCWHNGAVHALRGSAIVRIEGAAAVPVENGEGRGAMTHIASYAETLYVAGGDRVALFDGERFNGTDVADWGELPQGAVRDLLADGARMLAATENGLGVLRGTAWTTLRGPDGLPYEDLRSLTRGAGGDVWAATSHGAIRMTGDDFHYFAGPRWLPNDSVNGVAWLNGAAYIATDGGIGVIRYEPYTLAKKASFYEDYLDKAGQFRMGFTHKLEWNSDIKGWMREVSDNDVGWSTHYLTAQCFKYAVTGDKLAKERARYFFRHLKWSEEITPIDGFPARSIWGVGETGHQTAGGSGGYPAEWNPTDDGKWAWKGDTSSDETDAHYYAAAIFYELVADEEEKAMVREHLGRISSHLIDNGWVLRDLDGKPTVWGRWDPEYFTSWRGSYARGLNGMEALNYMITAHAITGEEKFAAATAQALEWGYDREVLRQKLVFPPDYIFHSDDRLAFYTYFPLLTYTADPRLRSIFRRSLERSWEIERVEGNPWFNYIYGALTGNPCEEERSAAHLREWPLDCIDHSFRNSHRHDLITPKGYVNYAGGTKPISPRERGPQRWTDATIRPDGGSNGHNVVDAAGWLDAYWMGRYFGMIGAPETKDKTLLEATVPDGMIRGAAPYDGPPSPFGELPR